MTHHRKHREPGPVANQDLDRLLEVERRLADRLAQARAEAQALLKQADSDADVRRRVAAEAAAARRRQVQGAIEEEGERRRRETAERWQGRVAGLEQIPEVRLEALADLVVRRVLGETSGPEDAA